MSCLLCMGQRTGKRKQENEGSDNLEKKAEERIEAQIRKTKRKPATEE